MFVKYLALALTLYPICAFSWSDHTFTTFYALKNVHSAQLQKTIQTETLQDFLMDMKKNHAGELQTAIKNSDQWATQNMPSYRPTHKNIFYNESKTLPTNIARQFLEGIRVNPNSLLFPYVRDLPSTAKQNFSAPVNLWNPANEISFKQVNLPPLYSSIVPGLHYFKINPTQTLPAFVVLSTAADEPELGLDLGLFNDNGTEFGKKYGFGAQPFGDKRVGLSSLTAFHYGAYHEWRLLYMLAPQTKECYAEYRIKLYRELAKAAFAAHHDYWGWRFLGFGLHYIQDLTQPYHAKFFPGYNTLTIIYYYALSIIGIDKPLTNTINLVANRHFLLEDFVLKLLQNPQLEQSTQFQNALMSASDQLENPASLSSRGKSLGEAAGSYDDSYPRKVISLHTVSYAENLSTLLLQNFTKKYVDDPSFLYVDKNEDILKIFSTLKSEQQKSVMNTIKPILEYTGIYSRSYLKDFL